MGDRIAALNRCVWWIRLRTARLGAPVLGRWPTGLAGAGDVLAHGARTAAVAVLLGVLLAATARAALAVGTGDRWSAYRGPLASAIGLSASALVADAVGVGDILIGLVLGTGVSAVGRFRWVSHCRAERRRPATGFVSRGRARSSALAPWSRARAASFPVQGESR